MVYNVSIILIRGTGIRVNVSIEVTIIMEVNGTLLKGTIDHSADTTTTGITTSIVWGLRWCL